MARPPFRMYFNVQSPLSMKLVGFKTVKPRKFSYKPMFFDQEKEEFANRLHQAMQGGNDPDNEALRMKMQKSWRLREKQEKKRAGIRNLLIALFLIILLIYFIFFV